MQLFIVGPALGLPSIDADCIAAVALLQSRREHTKDEWTLVPSYQDCPDHQLPLLIDGVTRLKGFCAIARHITDGRLNVDPKQRSDAAAISSFVTSNAQTLIDLSLYVAFENYRLTTRPTFTAILPWYVNYTIPPKLRAAARARTDHLGVSSIDLDTVHDDLSGKPGGHQQAFEPETQKRASLLLRQKGSVRSLLQRPEHAATFKLNALADNFFGPLQDMLGNHTYLLDTEKPTAVDCLAYGYLALMLYPKVPQDWLARTMRQKYNSLVRYTERLTALFNMRTNVVDVMSLINCKTDVDVESKRKACKMALPWSPPQESTVIDAITSISRDLYARLPLLDHRTPIFSTKSTPPGFLERYLPMLFTTAVTSAGLLGYYAFHAELLVWPRGEEEQVFGRKRFADYGAAGDAFSVFGMLGGQIRAQESYAQPDRSFQSPVEVEVDAQRVAVAREERRM